MAVFDVTQNLFSGERVPYEDDCVYILRLEGGKVTLKVDGGLSRLPVAQTLIKLGNLLAAEAERPSETAKVLPPSAGAKPETITEDLISWQNGYTAYKLKSGGWWWVRWCSDTGEMWGMSGPKMGAVAAKRGPFDNFDDTLASMMLHRAREANITEGDQRA